MFNCIFPFSQKALYSFECNDWPNYNNSALGSLEYWKVGIQLGPGLDINNTEECEALCVAEVRDKAGFYFGEYEDTLMEGKGLCFFDLYFKICWWINGNQESTTCGFSSCAPASGANCTIEFKSNGELIIFGKGFALHFAN